MEKNIKKKRLRNFSRDRSQAIGIQFSVLNNNYEALIHCYAKLGDYNKFEKYFRLLSIGKDSLINKLNELELIEIEAKYKIEESLRESLELQKENEEKEKEDGRKYPGPAEEPCDPVRGNTTTISGFNTLTTCWSTETVVASSVANSAGLPITFAPYCREISAISQSSVETTKSSRSFDLLAASIDHAISGFPHIVLIFLRGMPLLPPRAGIIPRIILSSY